ncbi:MAG: protein kinase, partial [Chloroflexaceae bacterium]|nr:protein kinase [Chloroflexaceae bacterium]
GVYTLTMPAVAQEPGVSLYRGEDRETQDIVWVKAYQRDMLATGSTRDVDKLVLLRDAVALRHLRGHRSIPEYLVRDDTGGEVVYVVLRREAGQFLRWHMERDNLSLATRLAILTQLLDGLAHIHAHRDGNRTALYRDLRPESVFVTSSGVVQLFNFDCSRLPAAATTHEYARQKAALWQAYASYELRNGTPDQIGPPTDVYSWGVVAYELLTGMLPYPDKKAQARGEFTALVAANLALPAALVAQIEQCLRLDADQRPTIAALHHALEEARSVGG